MPSGEANVQSADPPSEPKPNASSIVAELREPEKSTEQEPRQKQNKSGFQEHGLGLRELLDRVELEERLGEAQRVEVNAPVRRDRRVRREELAPVRGPVQQVPDRAAAQAPVVNDAVWRA